MTVARTIGRGAACDLVIEDRSVSRLHARALLTGEGYLSIQDVNSSNGTFLHRNGRWVRIRKVILGRLDRIRLGDHELPLDRLADLFGGNTRVRLRENLTARGKPLITADPDALRAPRVMLENPRRNPVTGDIEEHRKKTGD